MPFLMALIMFESCFGPGVSIKLLKAGLGSVLTAADYGRVFLVYLDGVAKLEPFDIAEVGLGFFTVPMDFLEEVRDTPMLVWFPFS